MKTNPIIRKQIGATAVEFAVTLMLFMLLIFGMVEWSLYLFNRHIITDASRRGARFGIVQATPRKTADEIEQKVLDYSSDHLVTFGTPNPDDLKINKPTDAPLIICTKPGDNLEVIVRYKYTFLLLPSLTLGRVSPSKDILARTLMRCE